jgi:hypothetical protein
MSTGDFVINTQGLTKSYKEVNAVVVALAAAVLAVVTKGRLGCSDEL